MSDKELFDKKAAEIISQLSGMYSVKNACWRLGLPLSPCTTEERQKRRDLWRELYEMFDAPQRWQLRALVREFYFENRDTA